MPNPLETQPEPRWPTLRWQIGVEAELLAPAGLTRRDLAERLAADVQGQVTPCFHAQTEPSLAPGVEVFDNLTLGFRVTDAAGTWVATCVDDLTLQSDLVRETPSLPGWFRIVSDDRRLLHLTAHLGRADGTLADALAPVARAFGTEPEAFPDGMIRVCDPIGAPVVIGAALPGERERPCELVTAPLPDRHGERLDALLAPARAMGFTLAAESATHIHFDARPLRDARVVRNLVRLWTTWAPTLKYLVGTNPACRQLGAWPEELEATVESAGFDTLDWDEARDALAGVGLTKFCDFNISYLALEAPPKPTVEVRVLPGLLDTREIVLAAALFEGLLRRAAAVAPVEREGPKRPRPRQVRALLNLLPLSDDVRAAWLDA